MYQLEDANELSMFSDQLCELNDKVYIFVLLKTNRPEIGAHPTKENRSYWPNKTYASIQIIH
jgi:hypothetical protein